MTAVADRKSEIYLSERVLVLTTKQKTASCKLDQPTLNRGLRSDILLDNCIFISYFNDLQDLIFHSHQFSRMNTEEYKINSFIKKHNVQF